MTVHSTAFLEILTSNFNFEGILSHSLDSISYQCTYGYIPVWYCNLCIFMSMYSYCMIMYHLHASWHSSATLTEVSPCFFLSCKQMPGYKSQRRGSPHSSEIVLFYVLFVLCHSVYCLCVNMYCTAATGWQPNYSYQICHYIKIWYIIIVCCIGRMMHGGRSTEF